MEFVKPNRKYYQSYLEAIREYEENHVDTYHFIGTGEEDVFKKIDRLENGDNMPIGWVTASYFWMVDQDEFVGEICIRHGLTDALMRFGGHIGYGVRCSRWNQGIGTQMLAYSLVYARNTLGLDKVLVTCSDDNYGSAGVIEKNGGILQDKIENVIDGKKRLTRRYWITF